MKDDKNLPIIDNKKFPKNVKSFSWYSIICTWFFIGRIGIMPGTFASLAVYPLYYFLLTYVPVEYLHFSLYLITALIFLIGFIAISKFQEVGGVADYKAIVIDEVIGMLVTFCVGINYLLAHHQYYSKLFNVSALSAMFLTAFILFRFFDIFKLFGIKFFDKRFKGAFGIILDDIIAGIYAGLCIIFIHLLIVKNIIGP